MKSFIEEMIRIRGQQNLILCHDQADSDAIGAAYALSRLIGGTVAVPQQVASHTTRLIQELELTLVYEPTLTEYENLIIVDTTHLSQLGALKPADYYVIDHHSNNQLIKNAEAYLYDEVSSTSQLVYRVLRAANQLIDQKMALGMCAGILTDTIYFHKGDPEAFRSFGELLQESGLRYEDIQDLYSMNQRQDRGAIIDAALTARKATFADYHILVTEIETNIPTFAARALFDLGADASIVGYRNGDETEVRMYLRNDLQEMLNVQAIDIFRNAQSMKKGKLWGYELFAGFRSDQAQLDQIFEELIKLFHDLLIQH